MKIKVENLVPNEYNPRKLFRGAALEELKKSIEKFGLIEPIIVRSLGNSHYEVVAGMRRFTALKELNIKEIECRSMDLNDEQAIDIAFMENLQRQNLTPIEEAKMYLARSKVKISNSKNDKTEIEIIKEISDLYAVSESTIRKRLNLLMLPNDLQDAIENEELPTTIAYEISRLKQIEDNKISFEEMTKIYKEYLLEKDDISLSEINQRITQRINYHKAKKEEQEQITEQRIKGLENKIKETENSKSVILNQIKEKEEEIRNSLFFKDSKINGDLMNFLNSEIKKYSNNIEYEQVATKINELEDKISDIRLLNARINEKNIRICPFCYAGIDKDTILQKENIFKDQLELLKQRRTELAGVKDFISESIKELNRLQTAILKKEEFLTKYNKDLEVLNNG